MSVSTIRLKQLVPVLVITLAALTWLFPRQSNAIGASRSNGSDIFRNKCTICHGADGSGRTELGKKFEIPDLRSDEVQKLTDEELLKIIAEGNGAMPSFDKKLSREGIQQVVLHLRKLAKEN